LLQALLVQTVEGEKPQKLLARFEKTLGAMSGMLNALLDINQIEAGLVEAKPIAFSLNDLLDRLRDEFTYLAQTRNFQLTILPTSAIVESDPRLLEQMIRNLLGNAIKYTESGQVLLGCRRHGAKLRIEIWDTDIGIAANQVHAIFEEFHQVDNAARERSRGLGLGLSIVDRLAKLLDHPVDVRSVPGKGSTFTITLPSPVAEPVRLPPADGQAKPGIANTRQRCTVMVVDDDPDVLDLLEQLLRADGYGVSTTADAADAKKLFATGAILPDLLLTDYNLPGDISGLELLVGLRKTLGRELPGIILTGDISSQTMATIAAHDCRQLSKPVNIDALLLAIETLCPAGATPMSRPVTEKPVATSIAYIVDDDPEIRSAIREALEADGRSVEDFECAEAFLAAYRTGPESCLLVDAHLPGMGGVALLEHLRGMGDHLPTILITGSSDIGLAVAAMQSGACDFIEKPVGRAELLASIARAISQIPRHPRHRRDPRGSISQSRRADTAAAPDHGYGSRRPAEQEYRR
jgi:two-component system CheB/CheR fusion protein